MAEKLKIGWVYLLSTLFIALNSYLLTKDLYYGLLLPLAFGIALMYIVALDKILLLIVFLTPLAVNILDMDFGVGVSLPTEPLMLGVVVIFLLKLMYDTKYDNRVMHHPVTYAILFQLLWMFITTLTSEVPLVSIKALLSRIWFVIPFYFVIILLFRKYKYIKMFSWLYVTSLIIIIIYTTYRHATYGFDEQAGHWVMDPFYNDHTAYGAILALFVPVFFGFSFNKRYSKQIRLVAFGVFVVLALALFLSFSRAAWLSLAGAVGIYIIILLKIKFRWIFIFAVSVLTIFFTFQHQILDRLEKNKQDSSENFVDHVRSITNISSDASNLERINRWQAAIRLFEERPFFGWGPGTYQFVYAPYQRSKEKTVISTNAGDLGNAHSEYIGPLAEMGIIGMLSVLVIMVFVVITAMRVYKNARSKEVRLISLVTLLGLVTYYLHGVLNNFLDTDKLSVPFWGFIAILVALDLFHMNKTDEELTVGSESRIE